MIDRLLRWLTRPLSVTDEAGGEVDVIVILGAGLRGDGSLGRSAEERVEAGVAARARHPGKPLLLTGGSCDSSLRGDLRSWLFGARARRRRGRTEAEAMRERVVMLGVPTGEILVENAACSTEENAQLAAGLMRIHDLRRALLVTQPYHLKRSLALFRQEGVEACPIVLDDSWIYRGGWESLAALRWVAREYLIWGLGRLRRRPWAMREIM